MVFDLLSLDEELRGPAEELAAECGARLGKGTKIYAEKADRLFVKKKRSAYTVGYSQKHEFFRGLCRAFAGQECDARSAYSHLTLMHDCSRNAVPTVETVKKMVRVLAASGYDRLQLYTEDTYRIDGWPKFGYMRGAYSAEELKEMDAYAQTFGIELVPCIQTLAHLGCIFRWGEFGPLNDCNDILLCGDEQVYKLIDDMFSQLERCFTTRVAHIGMDEAHMVGLGKYLDQHGYENRFDIINRHLARVLEIAKKHGFTCYMWGDMFFRLAFNGEYYRFDKDIPAEVAAAIPKDVNLIYWDYYQTDKSIYDGMIKSYKKLGNPISFAGGAWKWAGFSTANRFSLLASRLALDSCAEYGVDDVMVTSWGDNGAEASAFSVLPNIVYYGERRYGDAEGSTFRAVTGCDFEDFLALDLTEHVRADLPDIFKADISKIFLYSDPLLGMNDDLAAQAERDTMKQNLKTLRAAAKRVRSDYRYIFENAAALVEAVIGKYNIGNEIRTAYLGKDGEALADACKALKEAEKKVEAFHKTFTAQWYRENKAEGMEVHDIRMGGLEARMRACRKRIEKYLDGKISSLPELETPRAEPRSGFNPNGIFINWEYISSASPF